MELHRLLWVGEVLIRLWIFISVLSVIVEPAAFKIKRNVSVKHLPLYALLNIYVLYVTVSFFINNDLNIIGMIIYILLQGVALNFCLTKIIKDW
jgi:hypothetical protein